MELPVSGGSSKETVRRGLLCEGEISNDLAVELLVSNALFAKVQTGVFRVDKIKRIDSNDLSLTPFKTVRV